MTIENNKKYCPECGTYRRAEEFKKLTSKSALKKNPDGYYWCCFHCYKNKVWVFAPENAPTNRKNRRKEKRLRRVLSVEAIYGLTENQYMAKINDQRNVCAICGKKDEGKVLCVDHDHATGEVRGLLCNNCNIGLGNLKDSIQILQSAIEYLHKYLKRSEPPEMDKVPE